MRGGYEDGSLIAGHLPVEEPCAVTFASGGRTAAMVLRPAAVLLLACACGKATGGAAPARGDVPSIVDERSSPPLCALDSCPITDQCNQQEAPAQGRSRCLKSRIVQ